MFSLKINLYSIRLVPLPYFNANKIIIFLEILSITIFSFPNFKTKIRIFISLIQFENALLNELKIEKWKHEFHMPLISTNL